MSWFDLDFTPKERIILNRNARKMREDMEVYAKLRSAFSAIPHYGHKVPEDVNKDSENQTEEK